MALRGTRGLVLLAVVVLVLAVASTLALSQRCDRQIGDETDFPLFVLAGKAICGAGMLAR